MPDTDRGLPPRREVELPVPGGSLKGIDFGGRGRGVLLVHGTGQNAAAWTDVATHMARQCHAVAIDLRGHGQTRHASTGPEEHWRDLGSVVEALGWQRPLVVGHSSGGYAAVAATASGLLDPCALCIVDGMVLDDRGTALAEHARLRSPEGLARLSDAFHYGWRAHGEEMRAYVDACARQAREDWPNASARPRLVREVAARSFVVDDAGEWLRQPALEEIAAVTDLNPAAAVLPSREVYDHLACPTTFVLASDGFYAQRRREVLALVEAAPERKLVDLASTHNVPMTRPADLAWIVRQLLRDTNSGG